MRTGICYVYSPDSVFELPGYPRMVAGTRVKLTTDR